MTRRRNACSGKSIGSSVDTVPFHANPSDRARRSKPSAESALDGLFLVATPIGNAADITLRALDHLARVDVIACEDTRITSRLLAIHGIDTALTPYHEHNAARARPALIKRLKNGQTVALVSDAGTPLVSDPGYKLVQACLEAGIRVTPLPGASSVLAALTVSGLPSDRFLFAGFLPNRQAARRRALESLAAVPATLVFMESPRRLAAMLGDVAAVLGGRQTAVTRELTKLFEEVRRGPVAELSAHYRTAGAPRGEVTVVVAPPAEGPAIADAEIDRMLETALEDASVRDAAADVAAATGLSRRRIYTRALELERRRT